MTSSSVARNAATSACGSFWMKPDGVDQQHVAPAAQPGAPDQRVERHEELARDRRAARA